jgi:hypothetical protein
MCWRKTSDGTGPKSVDQMVVGNDGGMARRRDCYLFYAREALMKTVIAGLILAAVASLLVWGPIGPVIVAGALGGFLAGLAEAWTISFAVSLSFIVALWAILRFMTWVIPPRVKRPKKYVLPPTEQRSAEQARNLGLDAVQRELRPISVPKRRVYSEAEAEAWSELVSGFDADYKNRPWA